MTWLIPTLEAPQQITDKQNGLWSYEAPMSEPWVFFKFIIVKLIMKYLFKHRATKC